MAASRKILAVWGAVVYAVALYFVGSLQAIESTANLYYAYFSTITILVCFVVSAYVGVGVVSVLNLFLVSYGVFVFGRCFYIAAYFFISGDQLVSDDLYSLFWMAEHVVDAQGAFVLFSLTNSFILFVTIGYILAHESRSMDIGEFDLDKYFQKLMLFVFFLSAPFYFYDLVGVVLLTMNEGYLAKFSGQADGVGKSSILKHFFYISLISLIVLSKSRTKYYFIFLLVPLLSILSGGRGGFVYPVLTFVYLFSRLNPDFKVSFLKVSIMLAFVFLCMSFLLRFSARGQASTDGFFDLLYFLYSQGITLGVISFAILSELPYEWHTLAQSFVPAMSKVYAFFNPDTPGYMGSVTTFISYHANPEMFIRGNGLGSSIVSELYLLSFGIFPLFLIGCFVLGFFFSWVESNSYRSWRFLVFLIVVLPLIINSPRNGFNVLFVSSIYVFMFLMFLIALSRMRVKFSGVGY